MTPNKYAILYGCSALLLALITWQVSIVWLQLLLLWPVLSLLTVAIAYGINRPKVFRKGLDGRIPWWTRWLFIPFLLGARIYNGFRLYHDRELPLHKVDDNLYLGSRLTGITLSELQAKNIDAILDVTAEFDAFNWRSINADIDYLNVPVLDHAIPKLTEIKKAIHWLHQHLQQGNTVMVHCALGRGRSFLLVLAYLLSQNQQAQLSTIMNDVQAVRKKAKLNRRQLKALKHWHNAGELKVLNNVWLLVNPKSGGGSWKKQKKLVQQILQPHFHVHECKITRKKSAADWMNELRLAPGDKIVACGGDGTVAAVACELIDSDLSMGIIPLGTANALAKTLFGLWDATIENACEAIVSGQPQTIDTAQCNGKPFLLLAAVGFEQQMVVNSEQLNKDTLGQLAYLQGLWRAINENTQLTLELELDERETLTLETSSLVVANLAPITSVLAQGGGSPDYTDGLLDITWLDPGQGVTDNAFRLVELALTGAQKEVSPFKRGSSSVHHRQAKTIKISVKNADEYVLDGEVYNDLPLTIHIKPQSLTVLVPADG